MVQASGRRRAVCRTAGTTGGDFAGDIILDSRISYSFASG